MTKFRRLGSAFVLATVMTTGILTTTPAYAAKSTGICKVLARALAAAQSLPDGEYKTALINYINDELTEYSCN